MSFCTVNTIHFIHQRLLDQVEKLSFLNKIKSFTKTSVTTFLSPTRIPHSQIRVSTAYSSISSKSEISVQFWRFSKILKGQMGSIDFFS